MSRQNETSDSQTQKKWLDVSEAAAELGVSAMTIYHQVAAKKFPAVRIGDRIRIPAAALTALADEAVRIGAVIDTADWREVLMTG